MKVLDRLPFSDRERFLPLPDGRYLTIQPFLVVVHVSLKFRDKLHGPIPAFLDSGHNHNFAISKDQFRAWIGIDGDILEPCGRMKLRGQQITLRRADVLIHRNETASAELRAADPFSLDVA